MRGGRKGCLQPLYRGHMWCIATLSSSLFPTPNLEPLELVARFIQCLLDGLDAPKAHPGDCVSSKTTWKQNPGRTACHRRKYDCPSRLDDPTLCQHVSLLASQDRNFPSINIQSHPASLHKNACALQLVCCQTSPGTVGHSLAWDCQHHRQRKRVPHSCLKKGGAVRLLIEGLQQRQVSQNLEGKPLTAPATTDGKIGKEAGKEAGKVRRHVVVRALSSLFASQNMVLLRLRMSSVGPRIRIVPCLGISHLVPLPCISVSEK